ncbi:hypothetical protein AB0I39_28090 [Kitasatospora purpeofusca]|uniref:hypothetical protein n=1 Tax=Kitasatospora purpeofusca TaxID=67352 RepID=UPI003410FB3E
MNDPEQQDGEDEAQDDGEAAVAEVGVGRVRIAQLLPRDYDPLGPLGAQPADISRMVNQPLIDAMASIEAQQNARFAAAVNAVVKPTLDIVRPPVVSGGLQEAVAAAIAWQNSAFENALGIVGAAAQVQADLLGDSLRLIENNFATAYSSPLSRIAEDIGRTFTKDLFAGFAGFRDLFKDFLPDNLTGLDATRWMWLLRVAAKDGTCLAWAPRAEIVDALLALPGTADRRQYLIDHRLEVVEDVEASLEEVDHPDLLDLRTLTLQAAACIRDGHDAPAQALLGNVLDTLMTAHGRAWLRSYFPQGTFPPDPRTGSHKVITGVLGAYTGNSQLRRLSAVLLVTAMKNVFLNGVDRQHTFNRHLSAHKASTHTYRTEFAFAALLNTQALLRLVDRYLYV